MLFLKIIPFLCGWIADRLQGDPQGWPHPVVWFGKAINFGEKKLNTGTNGVLKGGLLTLILVGGTYHITELIIWHCSAVNYKLPMFIIGIGVFFCLSGKTLANEVKAAFDAVDRSTEEGRKQVSRIVGRDTSQLSAQQIRTAALETAAESLSDGVIAPMFWFAILGLPGMMAYKMINTLDSMIGYKNERYNEFGRIAAKLDDIVNFIPARITAMLMLFVSGKWNKLSWVMENGKNHTSPNAGFPEAALAAILDCRFGGPNFYSGQLVDKPYIGSTEKVFTSDDMLRAIQVNNNAEMGMGILVCVYFWVLYLI